MYNHSRFSDGQDVTTSEVVSVLDNRYVITQSGSKYLLDNPSYEYTIQRQKEKLHSNILFGKELMIILMI